MKLQELDNWFNDLQNIIIDLNISINNARYLIKEIGTDSEQSIKNHGFFNHHIYQLKFIVVIQLCKILQENNNQKRNLFKLFNRLINEGYDDEFNELLLKNSTMENAFKSKEEIIENINAAREEIINHKELISKIVCLRDEVYAHKDKKPPSSDIYWEELEKLIKLSTKFYSELHNKFYNCDPKFEKTPAWGVEGIIQGFAYYKGLNKRKSS